MCGVLNLNLNPPPSTQPQHAAVTLWSHMYFKSGHAPLMEALLHRCNGLQQGDSRFLLKVRRFVMLPSTLLRVA